MYLIELIVLIAVMLSRRRNVWQRWRWWTLLEGAVGVILKPCWSHLGASRGHLETILGSSAACTFISSYRHINTTFLSPYPHYPLTSLSPYPMACYIFILISRSWAKVLGLSPCHLVIISMQDDNEMMMIWSGNKRRVPMMTMIWWQDDETSWQGDKRQ